MAIRQVREKEWTKDGRKWIYETRYNNKTYKSKKYLTKKDAIKAEREFLNEMEAKHNPTEMTLGGLFEEHYNYQKDKVKATTLTNYGKKIKYFDSLKDIKLSDLNINHIEKWKDNLNQTNLATRTKNDLFKYLKSALNYGTKWHDFNFISMYNKMTNFDNPNEIPKEMEFYTWEEFNKFISVEDDLKWICIFETFYYCGLRRGELRGLMWKNIDFKKRTLTVMQNVVSAKGESGYWYLTTPKTRTSNRTIPLSDKLYNDLLKYKETCKKYYGFSEKWFVFGDVNPIHPGVLRVKKNENANKAGVKQIRLHDFRHSCASLLINNGANVTIVAKYLGHAKIDETLNTYSHIFDNKMDEVVNTINKLNITDDNN